MENRLLVFVSSVIDGMEAERQAVKSAIEAIPVTRPWLFEFSPASSLPLRESYLSKVRECDIFVLLLKDRVTDPVKAEVSTAQTTGKPILVLLWKAAPQGVVEYAHSIDAKHSPTFDDEASLRREVTEAVGEELITSHRRHRVPSVDLTRIGEHVERVRAGDVQMIIQRVSGHGTAIANYGIIYNATPPEDSTEALTRYLELYVADLRPLPLRALDPGASDPHRKQEPMDLGQVYIDLDTTSAVVSGEAAGLLRGKTRQPGDSELAMLVAGSGRRGPEDRRSLSALGATVSNRRLVILGDPGSGKSTFLSHLGLRLALNALEPGAGWLKLLPGWPEPDLIPITVILRDFARGLCDGKQKAVPHLLWDFIVKQLDGQVLRLAETPLRNGLENGKAIVFLDGLDEVPTVDQRTLVRDAVAAFARRYPRSRMVVTCRTLSYQDSAWQLGETPAFELAPFDPEKIDTFIGAWYAELVRLHQFGEEGAHHLAGRLRKALRRPDLAELASNPLLLTVMALVHSFDKKLPDARAKLYQRAVDLLLWRWETDKLSDSGQMPLLLQLLAEANRQDIDLERVLCELAFEAHRESCGSDGGRLAGIAQARLETALAELHPQGSLAWAKNVTEVMKARAGILLERAGGIYTFPHRTFQEYLAGAHLAAQPDFPTQAALVAEGAFWREVILLAVGQLVYVPPSDTGKPLLLAAELCPSAIDATDLGWRRAWLAGDVLLEIGTNRAGDSKFGRELLDRVPRRLADLLKAGALAPVERAAAGDTLARLGDSRFRADRWHLPDEPLLGFVKVGAGTFTMGSKKGKDVYDDEQPQHPVAVPEYYIARYPVTVAQFRAFVESSSYTPKDPDSLQGLPNHPVATVTFYDAIAYCTWLTERLKEWKETPEPLAGLLRGGEWRITLPSEAEWERAARGEDGRRVYPWAGGFDANRCNCYELRLYQSTPVGMFLEGASPYGCLDMSGNVWEWTRSLWGEYPYPKEGAKRTAREDIEAPASERRVLRGGSFDYNLNLVRCAYRGRDDPGYRYDNFGFRVAASPFP